MCDSLTRSLGMASVLFSSQVLWVWEEKVEGSSTQTHHLLYPFKSYQGSVYRAEKMGYEEAALLGGYKSMLASRTFCHGENACFRATHSHPAMNAGDTTWRTSQPYFDLTSKVSCTQWPSPWTVQLILSSQICMLSHVC